MNKAEKLEVEGLRVYGVNCLLEEAKNYQKQLINKKVVWVAMAEGLSSKILKVNPVKTKPKRVITNEEKDKIKNAKKLLKDRTDILYLYTLLVRTTEELHKVKIKKMDINTQKMIKSAIGDIFKSIKLLEGNK